MLSKKLVPPFTPLSVNILFVKLKSAFNLMELLSRQSWLLNHVRIHASSVALFEFQFLFSGLFSRR